MTFEIGQWVIYKPGDLVCQIIKIDQYDITTRWMSSDGRRMCGASAKEYYSPLRAPGEFKVGDEVEIQKPSPYHGEKYIIPSIRENGDIDLCVVEKCSRFYCAANERHLLKLITPVEVREAKKPNVATLPVASITAEDMTGRVWSADPIFVPDDHLRHPSSVIGYANRFPRPIKRSEVRVGDEISIDGKYRAFVHQVTDFHIIVAGGTVHFDRTVGADFTLHSRKGECDEGSVDGSGNDVETVARTESSKPDRSIHAPVCRGDIPVKPLPEGFRKASLGGTVCIIPKADWKPKQPEEKSPEEIGLEGCDGYVFRVDAKNPYHLYAGIDKNQCDAGDRTHESLDIRIKKHLEAREK